MDQRVVELRQYTLHPGGRDVLIELFDRAFVEGQEAVGVSVLGQFRDLDDPDKFVWLRGFPDMATRAESLGRFYGGPVWRANSARANATMIDSDDVLLLRPSGPMSGSPTSDRSGSPTSDRPGFPVPSTARPVVGAVAPSSVVLATLWFRDRPVDDAFVDLFDREIRPALVDAGAGPLAWLRSEYAENTFPALPVRTGEHVFGWFTRFPDLAGLDAHLERGRQPSLPGPGTVQQLRLAPTGRSLLR